MSWWAEKINTGPAAPAPGQRQASVDLPGNRQAVRNVYPGAQVPVASQQFQVDTVDPAAQEQPEDWHGAMLSAAEHWTSGPGMQEQAVYGNCPNCGSVNFFSRTNTEGSSRVGTYGVMMASGQKAAPAPHCYDCGYNGQYDLQGGSVVQGQAGGAPVKAATQISVARPTFEVVGRIG